MHFQDAIRIREQLAEETPTVYEKALAKTLCNLANLQKNLGEIENAERNFNKALSIFENLSNANPKVYLPFVSTTLTGLNLLYKANNNPKFKPISERVVSLAELYPDNGQLQRNKAKIVDGL